MLNIQHILSVVWGGALGDAVVGTTGHSTNGRALRFMIQRFQSGCLSLGNFDNRLAIKGTYRARSKAGGRLGLEGVAV